MRSILRILLAPFAALWGGCGGGIGAIAIGGICVPCGLILLVAGVITAAVFIDLGGNGDPRRPPVHYQPPPDEPTQPQVNQIWTTLDRSAGCGVDGVGICDRDYGSPRRGAWNYGGPNAVKDEESGFYVGVGIDRMIYPDNAYARQRWGANHGHDRHANPVWTVDPGGISRYRYGPMEAYIIFHFANGDELYVDWDFDGSGAPIEFFISWDNNGPKLIGVFDHGRNAMFHPPHDIFVGQRN